MKLIRIIFPILAVTLVSGQSEDDDESLDEVDPSNDDNEMDLSDDYNEMDPGYYRRGLRGSQDDRSLRSTNVGNGGNARTGDAYGPFGTTGDAFGGNGGDGNIVVSTTSGGWWDRPHDWCQDHWCDDNWCQDHWCHDNWCHDHWCHQNWCGDHWCRRRHRCHGHRCHGRYPPYYGGSMNVGNGGNAESGSAYGPYGTTGDAYGGNGGDFNYAENRGW